VLLGMLLVAVATDHHELEGPLRDDAAGVGRTVLRGFVRPSPGCHAPTHKMYSPLSPSCSRKQPSHPCRRWWVADVTQSTLSVFPHVAAARSTSLELKATIRQRGRSSGARRRRPRKGGATIASGRVAGAR
jgi:hypothetical protein